MKVHAHVELRSHDIGVDVVVSDREPNRVGLTIHSGARVFGDARIRAQSFGAWTADEARAIGVALIEAAAKAAVPVWTADHDAAATQTPP